ncbi:MAG TPA: LysM peptidoglycan-binding domain-containing protein, partial [Parachlamydiaceae bacterium]|nr:LysM peptidoglycan-binding domain-containing protein [Parachlamydiaceae bacterium]
ARLETPVSKQEVLNVVLGGSFGMLSHFTEQQRQLQDLTKPRRQHFLLEYVKKQSKEAAYLLLKTDGPEIVRKFDDAHIQMLLALLSDKTAEAGKFALALLTSPRGDLVWEMAAKRLYEYAGEEMPEKFEHHLALIKFLPANMIFKKQEGQQEEKELKDAVLKKSHLLYIIQEGDSLWKISRRFDVDIDLLKQHNHLSSDFLKPGTSLKIP